MGQLLAIRSERDSLFTPGVLSNELLLGAVSLTFALQLATIYVPLLQPMFRTQPLTVVELALCLVLSCATFASV